MKRNRITSHVTGIGCALVAAILAGVLFTSHPARADVSVRIDFGNAPPAPRIIFVAPPHERRYSGDPVYVVDDPGAGDNDCFHYQGYYWVFRDGYWYRSAGWRGPFVAFDPRYVPAVFYRQPPTRWKHHPSGPPVFAHSGGGRPSAPARRNESPARQPVNRKSEQPPQTTPYGGNRHAQPMNPVSGRPSPTTHHGGDNRSQPAPKSVATPPRDQHGGQPASAGAKHGGGGPPGQAKKGGNAPAGKSKKDNGKGNGKGDGKGDGKGEGHGGN